MKKILFIACLSLMAFATQAQTMKIGYINSLEVLSLMPETKTADAQLQEMARELEAQYREYILEYQKLANQVQSDATLSEVAREAKIQDLSNLEKRITDYVHNS